ncbi:hypothetical protein IWZ03DRAFT_407342 [Phyllosticta citriasiana]|uniref:Uncharacterized protein n=1 Tax=Phyllosticta citriasiana TaxID=595635 RepID=A0ABR1KJI0_9PEZI
MPQRRRCSRPTHALAKKNPHFALLRRAHCKGPLPRPDGRGRRGECGTPIDPCDKTVTLRPEPEKMPPWRRILLPLEASSGRPVPLLLLGTPAHPFQLIFRVDPWTGADESLRSELLVVSASKVVWGGFAQSHGGPDSERTETKKNAGEDDLLDIADSLPSTTAPGWCHILTAPPPRRLVTVHDCNRHVPQLDRSNPQPLLRLLLDHALPITMDRNYDPDPPRGRTSGRPYEMSDQMTYYKKERNYLKLYNNY